MAVGATKYTEYSLSPASSLARISTSDSVEATAIIFWSRTSDPVPGMFLHEVNVIRLEPFVVAQVGLALVHLIIISHHDLPCGFLLSFSGIYSFLAMPFR